MIRRVVIRHFKCFEEVTFNLPGHIVLAGPNNMGKTTMLQAIAAWSLAFKRWKELNDFQRHGGANRKGPMGLHSFGPVQTHGRRYTKAPIARQAFAAVPLRAFDLLWNERKYSTDRPIEIEIAHTDGWTIAMEFLHESTEQIYVKPKTTAEPAALQMCDLKTVYVPPMTGLNIEEPVYQPPYVNRLLGQGKPGDIIRNLLVEAHGNGETWIPLTESIQRLFGYEMLPPDDSGPLISVEYRTTPGGPRLDIANAGSGFQQVLMLLAFLYTRPASVLLLDEPDAHLHVILQDAIYGELRAVAAKQNSQLIIATHSEVIINSVDPGELCVMLNTPRLVASSDEKRALISSLGVLTNVDIMEAMDAPGILYTEDYTDLDILRAWASVLGHPALETLTKRLFWKRTVIQAREGASGIQAKDHYDALKLVRPDFPGLILVDGDARPEIQASEITGQGLQRVRWKRYEIESYLLHPAALARFVEKKVGVERGAEVAKPHVAALMTHLEDNLPPAVLKDPLGEHEYLNNTKARTKLLPPALAAAGLPSFPYTSYSEIAAEMTAEEIHPEVKEKLDAIQKAFNL